MLVNMNNTDNYTKSDIDNPIAFFEEFFPKGFDKFYHDFYNYTSVMQIPCYSGEREWDDEIMVHVIETNEEEGYIIVDYTEFGRDICSDFRPIEELIPYTLYFKDKLVKHLDLEIEKSKQIILEVLLTKDTNTQKSFIHTLFSNIAYIIDYKIPQICNRKYKILCQNALISFMREIIQRYPYLRTQGNTSYAKYINANVGNNENKALHVRENKLKYLPILFDKLKDEGFIEKGLSLDLFKKAFDGNTIYEPLNIRWIKMRGTKMNYIASLVVMIDKMKDMLIIEHYQDAQLSNIFVRHDGTLIKVGDWKSFRQSAKNGNNDILDDVDSILKDTLLTK